MLIHFIVLSLGLSYICIDVIQSRRRPNKLLHLYVIHCFPAFWCFSSFTTTVCIRALRNTSCFYSTANDLQCQCILRRKESHFHFTANSSHMLFLCFQVHFSKLYWEPFLMQCNGKQYVEFRSFFASIKILENDHYIHFY